MIDTESEQVIKDLLAKVGEDVTAIIKRNLELIRPYVDKDDRTLIVKAVAISAGCAALAAMTAMMAIEFEADGQKVDSPTAEMIMAAALLMARSGCPNETQAGRA